MQEIISSIEERAVLIAVKLPEHNEEDFTESLDELASLANTAGATVVGLFVQNRQRPDTTTFMGKGKAQELADYCQEVQANLVISDKELSPAQSRNLEDVVGVRVIDRTQVILDIFARRAQTREGKLQVELAQLKYLLPRLVGQGAHLSRLGGGIGTRGPGETKLETDRRRLRRRISDLEKDLSEVQKHRELLRKNRQAEPLPLVSLVGYTNAGKSTLLKTLTGADILVEDKLFATLDPTTRRVTLPNRDTILLTDTVGFIQNLPHHLVAAFRATLEEVQQADLLLHVVDASNPNFEGQIEAVEAVLSSLDALNKPTLFVFNKIDQTMDFQPPLVEHPIVQVSALLGESLEQLLSSIASVLKERYSIVQVTIPYDKQSLVSVIHQKGKVLYEAYESEGIVLRAEISKVWAGRIREQLR